MGTKKGLGRPLVLLSSHEENLLWEGKDLEIRGIITNFVGLQYFHQSGPGGVGGKGCGP